MFLQMTKEEGCMRFNCPMDPSRFIHEGFKSPLTSVHIDHLRMYATVDSAMEHQEQWQSRVMISDM
jgi:hypothetical protein